MITIVLILLGAAGSLGAVAAALTLMRTSRESKVLASIDRTREVPLANADDGERVKVRGRVRLADDVLEAPLTARRCAAYDIVAVMNATAGEFPLILARAAVPFWLDAPEGKMRVVPGSGEGLALDPDAQRSVVPARGSILEKLVVAQVPNQAIAPTLVREGIVEEGEWVAVVGRVRREIDLEAPFDSGYRDRATRLVLEGTTEEPILVTDIESHRGKAPKAP